MLCLFTDWAGSAPVPRLTDGRLMKWWRNALHGLYESDSKAGLEPDPERACLLKEAASHYGVPLVSLEAALDLGLFGEWGVAPDQIEEVEAWVAVTVAAHRRD